MVRRMKIGRQRVDIVCEHRRKGQDQRWGVIKEWMEERNKELVLITGDLNAWTGELGGEVRDEGNDTFRKNSKHTSRIKRVKLFPTS